MTDLFEEVEEQLRSDRYRTLAFKALPWIAGIAVAALLAFAGYWGWGRYQESTADKAADQYAAALEAFNGGQRAQAVQLWGQAAKSPSKGYASLSLMHLGGLQLGENKTAEAVKLFDEAAEKAPDEMIGDAARLKSAFALLDTAPYKDLETRLTPLLEDGRPYRVQAREALAFAKIMKGDTAGARGDFAVISQTLDAPEGARARATAAMQLIDSGSSKIVPAAARAAAALPPQSLSAPGPTPSAQPQTQAPGPQ